jgi:SUN family beta-glucosidase
MHVTLSLLTAAVAVAAAHPRNHAHKHGHEKRWGPEGGNGGGNWGHDVTETTLVVKPGPTVEVYVLNGRPISAEEVQEGIRNGTLVWAPGAGLQEASSSSSAYVAPTSTSTSVYVAPTTSTLAAYTPPSSAPAPSSYEAPSSSSEASPTSTSAAPSPPAQSSSSPSPPSYGGGDDSNYDSDTSDGVNTPFPDGELDCSTFPSDYGAVPVDWMNLGGWTGIQSPGSDIGGFSNIMTLTKAQFTGACPEGSFCSYACPAGYQKSQWPSTQGATGQSVGGIQCSGGKLRLTNSGLSDKLCMQGAEQVTILVQNKLSQNVAVCRTDYPGTEGETVPLDTQPGSTSNLTCPDAENYYNWEGGHTSAQYYVNPEGVSVSDACQWGSSANPWGNYAPLNLGVGWSNGAAWLSIFQNAPTTYETLDFSVEITGDNLSGTCKYSNGQYCSGPNYSSCSSTTGCTVNHLTTQSFVEVD